jgi:hypothetical protein
MCRAHNHLLAELDFGRAHVEHILSKHRASTNAPKSCAGDWLDGQKVPTEPAAKEVMDVASETP